MKDQYYAISNCCNTHCIGLPQNIFDTIKGLPRIYICINCNEKCDISTVPVYTEVFKGAFRKNIINPKQPE